MSTQNLSSYKPGCVFEKLLIPQNESTDNAGKVNIQFQNIDIGNVPYSISMQIFIKKIEVSRNESNIFGNIEILEHYYLKPINSQNEEMCILKKNIESTVQQIYSENIQSK